MFYQNTLSLTKVLSGISKGLGIVNQALPIYKEIKPMVTNAKKIIDITKEFNKSNNKVYLNEKKEVNNTSNIELDNIPKPSFFL